MDVALKIWRSNPETGERELKRYEVEAPEWADYVDWLLYVAAEYGHVRLVERLLAMGANPENPNGESGPAVSAAMRARCASLK